MERMKTILSNHTKDIPETVVTTPNGCTVMVKGPTGSLWRILNHSNMELSLIEKRRKRLWVDK